MTTAKPAAGQPFRHDARRLDRDEMKRIVTRQVRIELEAQGTAPKPFNPAMVGTGILAGIAFIFSVMSWLNEGTQDKVGKITGPLASQVTEMDRRLTGRIERLESRVDKVDERLLDIEKRLERIDGRFDAVDARFDAVDKQFATVNRHFDAVNEKLELLLKRR
ncbi:hypothetical protein [Cupriavidus oxalaticus]|nr:hypothetical protein [Cupriavidus oxalaticus]